MLINKFVFAAAGACLAAIVCWHPAANAQAHRSDRLRKARTRVEALQKRMPS